LIEVLDGVVTGRPSALLLHGEAGAGKTRLLDVTVDEARRRGVEVLRGTCVHFATSVVPYGALTLALRSWKAAHRPAFRDDFAVLLAAADPHQQTAGSSSMLRALDEVVQAICAQRPVLLVVDDVQWADDASLDFLAYVIAGLEDQRLGLLLAFRDEDRRDSPALEGWLRDTSRMPTVGQLLVEGLDEDATGQLVTALTDGAVTPELVGQVYALTGGNPYFTELLVRHVRPDGTLPERPPVDLAEAVVGRWRALSTPGRELTRLLALAGSPQDVEVLQEVARRCAAWLGPVAPLLAQGAAAGVLQMLPSGPVWFRHPLLADLLLGAPTRLSSLTVHTAYAKVLEDQIHEHGAASASVAAVALHHQAAGNTDAAFRWAVRAAAEAERVSAWTMADEALERACSLWTRVSPPVQTDSPGLLALLRRAARAARAAGALDRRLAYLARAQECVDEKSKPLLASRLLVDWCTASWDVSPHGRQTILPELFHAVALTEQALDSPERAVAIAELAIARVWNDDPEPADVRGREVKPGWAASRTALDVARRSGAPAALARAHVAAALVEFYDPDSPAASHLEAAYRYAAQENDPLIMGFAAIYWSLWMLYKSRLTDSIAMARRFSAEVLAAGDPVISTFLAASGAAVLLSLGGWDECRHMLRPALAAGRLTFGGATASFVASMLSTRMGDLRQAQAHVDRMLELVDKDWVGWPLDQPIVELQLARGNPRSALASLRERYELVGWRDQQGDLHTALGATAAADLAQEARDRQDAEAEREAQAALEEMLSYGAELNRHPRAHIDDPVSHRSWGARLAAEVARCRRDPDEAEAWEAAMLVNRESGYRWDEALCGWRFAQALLRGEGARPRARERLRRAYLLASELGAEPLVAEIHALARAADLNVQPVPPPTPPASRAKTVLSEREQEVLAHVGAGRTNGEIAQALFISEKTASVHVSNILRKTGTHSRIEAATWGRRTGVLPSSDAD
jgi:DNA-binding CsgD family transcriptional regulator